MKLYIICMTAIDPENGKITVNTCLEPKRTKEEAVAAMREAYEKALRDMGLEDNSCENKWGDAVPGGFWTEEEAGIMNYAEFAFNQLLELVSFTIVETNLPARGAL